MKQSYLPSHLFIPRVMVELSLLILRTLCVRGVRRKALSLEPMYPGYKSQYSWLERLEEV